MITASVVLFNTKEEQVEKIINSLINSIEMNIIYIIDNSPSDYYSFLVYKSNNIRYIHHDNTGYGSSHNVAIRLAIESGSNYHLVVNPDIYFNSDVIPKIAKYMDQNSNIGLIMPKILYPNGELQYLCKLIPTPLDLIFKRFLPKVFTQKTNEKFQLKFTDYSKQMEVPYLSGCFMFFRISSIQDIGLFDERFFMYPEDLDISRRMCEKYRTVYYPEVYVVHEHAAESYKNNKMLLIHITNMIKYFNKWGWLFDNKRKEINKRILKQFNYKELI